MKSKSLFIKILSYIWFPRFMKREQLNFVDIVCWNGKGMSVMTGDIVNMFIFQNKKMLMSHQLSGMAENTAWKFGQRQKL